MDKAFMKMVYRKKLLILHKIKSMVDKIKKDTNWKDIVIGVTITCFLGIGSWGLMTLISLNNIQIETNTILKQVVVDNNKEHSEIKKTTDELKTQLNEQKCEVNSIDKRLLKVEYKTGIVK